MTTESTTTPKLKRRRLQYSLRMHWFTCLIICVTLAALIERQCEKEQIFGLANLGSFELYYTFGWPVASLKVIESGKIGSPVITNRVANLLPWKLAVNCSFGVLLTLATALCCERLVRSKRRIQFTLLQLFVVMAALGAVMSLTHRITVPCYHWDNLQGLSNEWSVIAWSDVIHPVRWPLLLALICLACVLVRLIGKILQMAYFATTKPHRRWLRFSLRMLLVLMVVVGCGFGWFLAVRHVNAAAEESDEPESPARARLELRATGARRNPVLVVTLRNISDTPIVVDRELLFALWLKARLSTGDYVGPTVVRREEPPKRDAAEWERRFRRLAPGEEVTRRIKLYEGFRSFHYMVGIYPGLVERLSGGAEYVERFDRDLDITHVLVDYTFYPSTPHPYFAQAFEGYTGLRLKAINLFDGDLQTEIELPR